MSSSISSKRISVPALATALCLLLISEGLAQSNSTGYGLARAMQFQRGNSAANFTASVQRNRVLQRAVPQFGVAGVNRVNYLSNKTSANPLSKKTKPFSSLDRGPSVSPYLALSLASTSPFSTSNVGADYYSLVRPLQQLEQQNNQRQRNALQRQHKLNQLAARGPYSITGNEDQAPTGHVAVFQSLGSFQNTGGYYPPPSRPKQDR